MKRNRLRDYLNKKRRLLDYPVFNFIRHRLHAETLWHLNRRSLAGGIAAGLFAAFIPFPVQMLTAALLAITWQANIPVALVATWTSNPLTYAPIFYGNYKVGIFVLHFFSPVIPQSQSFIERIQDVGGPFLLGSFCAATIAAAVGYGLARGVWRCAVLYKLYRRRGHRSNN